jgi:hypothetical protein
MRLQPLGPQLIPHNVPAFPPTFVGPTPGQYTVDLGPYDGLEATDTLDWPLAVKTGERSYMLMNDFVIEWQAEGFPRQMLIVPAGFEYDGASVPRIVEWYVGRDALFAAATAHDWHYAHAGVLPEGSHLYQTANGQWLDTLYKWTRLEADRFFARNLRFPLPDGRRIRGDQRRNAYRAVRLGGAAPWARAQRLKTT